MGRSRTVVDHNRCRGESASDRWAGLEEVGILVWVAQDAGDRSVRTGHLLRYIAVEVLCRHDANRSRRRLSLSWSHQQNGSDAQGKLHHGYFLAGYRGGDP
jgi:hypothetical protein